VRAAVLQALNAHPAIQTADGLKNRNETAPDKGTRCTRTINHKEEMNAEDLRQLCLSLSPEVTEKFPFQQFRAARNVLAFYIGGHMFCYFDINDMTSVTVKAPKAEIPTLYEQYDFVDKPYNGNEKYWIGIDATVAPAEVVRRLVQTSFDLVKNHRK
jgi:predicted DNA-binding protein (MmcQ/YjbR family)